MPLEEKVKNSDFIIDNNGTVEQTQKQLNVVLNKLVTLLNKKFKIYQNV